MWGIYNTVSKKFVFGIHAKTENNAYNALFRCIGNDARKWRFVAKKLPDNKTK